jgi:hypothetical protein
MRVYEFQQRGYELIERQISKEVAMASDEGTLFRANSLAAKLFSSYVRMIAMPFTWFMLVTSVNSINDNAVDSFGDEGTPSLGAGSTFFCVTERNDTQHSRHATHMTHYKTHRWKHVVEQAGAVHGGSRRR